jgi:ribosomal protein L11 methylase PrmA
MEQNKTWYIHSDPKSYGEAKAFIDQYRRSVQRGFDRHVVMPKYIPQHSYVLDYGCGWGVFSEIVHQQRQCRVDGIDPDPHSIQIAQDFVREREGLPFSTQPIREIAKESSKIKSAF